ncbi:MAG: DUF3050 domain-containing protein, partial [Planctomycetota bacterium JB042]
MNDALPPPSRTADAGDRFAAALAPARAALLAHPVYAAIGDEGAVRRFMETHVFAVWDFQSLLKGLQRAVTCVDVPWVPTGDPEARRFVNEIVLDEESDAAPGGGHLSHFELYLRAMREAGADVGPIDRFVAALRAGTPVESALAAPDVPAGVRPFVDTTLRIARDGAPHEIAAAFAYGREEVIPGMFRRLVDELARAAPSAWETFRDYLERHIGLDADEHGPKARRLVES